MKSVPKNGVKNEALAEYIRRFANSELPTYLRDDGVSVAWLAIAESTAGIDILRTARRAIWRLKAQERRRRCRELSENDPRAPSQVSGIVRAK